MKQKGLAPILIVLLIALGIGGYLLYQKQQQTIQAPPTPTSTFESTNSAETANWKTYANDKYNFSFKYPSNFSQVPIAQNTLEFTPVPWPSGEIGENELKKVGYGIGVLVSPTKKQTLKDLVDSYDRFKTRADYSKVPTTIDNVSAYKLTDVAMDFPTDAISLLKNSQEYFIYVKYYSLEKKIEAKNVFDQIISTFKFTN